MDDGVEVIGVDNMVTGRQRNIDQLQKRKAFSLITAHIADAQLTVHGQVDCVYNLACPASPVDFVPLATEILRTCSLGVENMLHLARTKEAVFIHTSTSECYGDPQVHPQPESYWGHVNCTGIRSPYDEGKRYAEALIFAHQRKHGQPVRVVRLFNTYGPGMRPDDGRVLPTFIRQALKGQPLTICGSGNQTRSYCYVADTVDGIIRAAHRDHAGPINLGNPNEITINKTAEEIIELTNSTSVVTYVHERPDDPVRRCPDISLAKKLLDWEPRTDRRTGFLKTIEFFRSINT
jgi:dTDP-glucose 4,6-dehydratase